MTKRALALAGGGPAAGLHIGVLKRLNEEDKLVKKGVLDFDVWSLSCIGAWVGIVYNQFEEDKSLQKTREFFRNGVFRNDISYSRFPINSVFGPDIFAALKATSEYISNPESYQNLVLPDEIIKVAKKYYEFCTDSEKHNQGDLNSLILESMSVNPMCRYLVSMMYLSKIDGLSRIYYPNSSFLKQLDFNGLRNNKKPFIFHNAWNLTTTKLEQFANRPDEVELSEEIENKEDHRPGYRQLSLQSLCACSALPFIEQTIKMNGSTYCEGALVDAVNFRRLVAEHQVDEIWVSRIVDEDQVQAPENIHDALANLCQLFAATVGEDDVKLFRYHLKEEKERNKQRKKDGKPELKIPELIEVDVPAKINFDWTHSNLENGINAGYAAADRAVKKHFSKGKKKVP